MPCDNSSSPLDSCPVPEAHAPEMAGFSLTLTDAAAKHISRYLTRRGAGIGIRVGVKTTGCSGFAYVLEYADEAAAADIVIRDNGVTVLVDPKSAPFLAGMSIDHVRQGLNEGFEFRNPNERDRCGCGESFRI